MHSGAFEFAVRVIFAVPGLGCVAESARSASPRLPGLELFAVAYIIDEFANTSGALELSTRNRQKFQA